MAPPAQSVESVVRVAWCDVEANGECVRARVCVLEPPRPEAGGSPAWNARGTSGCVCKKGLKFCLGAGASSNRVAEAVLSEWC